MKFFTLALVALGFILANANLSQVYAQADPFSKPAYQRPKDTTPRPAPSTNGTATTTSAAKPAKAEKPLPPPIVPVAAPAIQDRLNYYKRLREMAAMNGETLPKPTSVLTLEEMNVTGIFRTPRGYAAMVQAVPIGLSYTIYPGEKFFNGQLVAVEENKLVFRKVIKMSNGKFITSEENKTLREYSQQEEIQGTAPIEATSTAGAKPAETVPAETSQTGANATVATPAKPTVVVSPLDEMNKQPVETPKTAKDKAVDKTKKGKTKSSATKKSVKVATNTEN